MGMATTTKDNALSRTLWPVFKTALCLLEFYETTHGNEFGHDHHCPVGRTSKEPADTSACTCGWSLFEAAYHEYTVGITPEPPACRTVTIGDVTSASHLPGCSHVLPEPTGRPS